MADCVIGSDLRCSRCGASARHERVRRNCTASSDTLQKLQNYERNLAATDAGKFHRARHPRPGTELKALLKDWLGIEATPNCSCNSMAARMDALGPDWCESDAGMTEILGVMRTEHALRWADGRTKLPWTDLGAKQLVRLACRRSRAKPAT